MKNKQTTIPKAGSKPGRPLLSIIRRCSSILPHDDTFFRTLGGGNLSIGIRKAASIVRGKKGERP